MDIVAILLLLHVVSESLLTRGSRDMASITLGSVTSLAAIPLVGMWGAAIAAWSAVLAHNPEGTPVVKRLFNGARFALSRRCGRRLPPPAPGGLGPTAAASFPQSSTDPGGGHHALRRQRRPRRGDRGAPPARLPGGRVQGTMARSVSVRTSPTACSASRSPCCWDGAEIGPAAAVLLLLPLFVARWAYAQYAEQQRAYDRTVRTLMARRSRPRTSTPAVTASGCRAASVLDRPRRSACARTGWAAPVRRDAARHRQARRARPGSCRSPAGSPRRSSRPSSCHPMRGLEIVRGHRVPGRGERRHHAPPRAAGRPRLPDGPARRRDPRVRPGHRRRGRLRLDDHDPLLPRRTARSRTRWSSCAGARGTQFDPPMVEALVRGLDEHGWNPEVSRSFSPPDAEQVFDQDWRAKDHDDPTGSVAQESR